MISHISQLDYDEPVVKENVEDIGYREMSKSDQDSYRLSISYTSWYSNFGSHDAPLHGIKEQLSIVLGISGLLLQQSPTNVNTTTP